MLKFSLVSLISMGVSLFPYIFLSYNLVYSIDLYSCSTKIITIFYFLSISGTAIGGYSNIVLIMSVWTFFFNKNMACTLSFSVFIANTSNLIIKPIMYFLLYLNIFIFHLASAALLLSLNIILISLINLFQFWVSISSLS